MFSRSIYIPLQKSWLTGLFSGVTFALLGAALFPMIMLVNTTPDRIPADVVAEEQDAAREKIEASKSARI